MHINYEHTNTNEQINAERRKEANAESEDKIYCSGRFASIHQN